MCDPPKGKRLQLILIKNSQKQINPYSKILLNFYYTLSIALRLKKYSATKKYFIDKSF